MGMDERLVQLRKSIEMIEDIMKYAYEGYVLVDREGKVVMMEYEKLLGIKEQEALGRHIKDVIENTRMHIVVETGIEELRDVQRIGGLDVITNRIPILMDGEIIGALGTVLFKDINEVKELAHHLLDLQSKINKYKGEIERIEGVKYSFDNIITRSPKMQYLKKIGKKASETHSTVLITGPSGTGKELFAHAIHEAGYRKNGPFIPINCAAIPEGLLESELFGYEEGAFTGAREKGKIGKFELASGGTIFLDEVGDMPMDMQVKILRVLEEKEFERVGGNRKIKMDARVIAATNENLEKQVEQGKFREDLYYRLNVITIDIPPLKDRIEDVEPISKSMMKDLSKELNFDEKKLSEKAIRILEKYEWPGNVRELRNVLERAINLSNDDMINPSDLSDRILIKTGNKKIDDINLHHVGIDNNRELSDILDAAEKTAVIEALAKADGNKTEASKLLGIHRTSLYRLIDKHDL